MLRGRFDHGWRADLAAAACGAIAALALPPFTLPPLLLLAVPGLIRLIGGARGPAGAFRRGLAFGVAHHLVGLYWVTNAVLVQAAEFWWAVPLAVPALAFVLALFIAVPCALARCVPPGWHRVTMLAGAWVLGDLARQFVMTGFPWNPLGSTWEFPGVLGLAFMQPAAWVGVPGLTFGTLIVAASPILGGRARAFNSFVVLVWGIAGAARLLSLPPAAAPDVRVVLVQGNVSEIEHRDHWRDRDWAVGVFDRYLSLTRKGVAKAGAGPTLVIWPETASPFWIAQDAAARQAIVTASGPDAISLIGTPRADAAGHAFNSLLALAPDGTVLASYDKHHLVPYGEYFPSYLPIRLGEQGWSPGPGLVTLHLPGLPPLGPLICYEAIFPAQVVRETDRPAALVNITNDSWFGDSAGPRQHLAAARMRSVEEGLPMLRAANTGISAIIDAQGGVLRKLGLGHQGIVAGHMPGALPRTVFSRMGLAAPLFLALLACGFGAGITKRRVKTARG